MTNVYNFSAGPAVLPAPVMAKAQEEFCNFHGIGYGIMEASHRGPDFMQVAAEAEANIRELMGISDDYAVLFLQGGASTQFSMVPMNIMKDGGSADYADTGSWSSKAIKEAKLFGDVKVVTSSKADNYTHIPTIDPTSLNSEASYLHLTSNNTIFGTQYHAFPESPVNVPLVADMSSDIMCRPVDVSKFGIIYAGAQKNLGPSGVTLVIIRKDLADRAASTVPTMLKYSTHIDKESMFNTPPTFSIYMVKLVTDWLKDLGGLGAIAKMNATKAEKLYAEIDADPFYSCPAAVKDRSIMNVCFNCLTEDLEKTFLAEAKTKGLVTLKGHRSVGGIRAS